MARLLALLLGLSSSCASPWAGESIVVTGGSSGIGYTTTLELARAGAHVSFCARDSHPDWFTGAAAEAEINADPVVVSANGSARFFRADVSKLEEAKAFMDFVKSGSDILPRYFVNNAGELGWLGMINELPESILTGSREHNPIENNLYGVLNMMHLESQLVVNHTLRGAVIVNVASMNGLRASTGGEGLLYTTSKHAIYGATKSAALQFAALPNPIRVVAVAPGMVNTPITWNQAKYPAQQPYEGPLMTENSNPAFKKAVEDSIPNHRIAQTSEMASIILFLLSDAASYISGTAISADYGLAQMLAA